MAVAQIRVPHVRGYDFGVGVDRLSGSPMNLAVAGTPTPPLHASGATQSFEVSRVSSTHDLQKSLGIDVSASYGCASFGAGVSARFKFAESTEVHSSSLFMAVTATVHLADLSLNLCKLTSEAALMVDRPEIFESRYGNMFARACSRGGLFVGVLHLETFSEEEATSIESDLKGSYGLFSADASVKFKKVCADRKVSVYCRLYSEGGPKLQIHDPTDPAELLQTANAWMAAVNADPDRQAVPYEWTMSPISIAEGPLPLNQADIENAQDILLVCAQTRSSLLDSLNQLSWMHDHADKYDWEGAPSPDHFGQVIAAIQTDLSTIGSCASAAIDHPKSAVMPSIYASSHGGSYPVATPPAVLPIAKPPQQQSLGDVGPYSGSWVGV